MSTVELQNVTKIFDKTVKALDDISFTVKDAEFFVLLGPTGAGKTTTLRAIAGLEKVDQGKILFDQEDVTTAQPAARDTAFVFQQYSLYPHYKVFDNLAFPLRSPLRKVPEEEINSTGLFYFADFKFHDWNVELDPNETFLFENFIGQILKLFLHLFLCVFLFLYLFFEPSVQFIILGRLLHFFIVRLFQLFP